MTGVRPRGSCYLTPDRVMLEQRVLLVRPRMASALQAIVDGESGVPLGFARWEAAAASSWWPLFGRGVLAVHEQEDEPLLFTIRRAWSLLPRREVRDAEDQPVGTLTGRLVHDQYGRAVALLENGIFRGPRQRVLAEVATTLDGLRLTFRTDIADEPFLKMLLLAACLVNRGP